MHRSPHCKRTHLVLELRASNCVCERQFPLKRNNNFGIVMCQSHDDSQIRNTTTPITTSHYCTRNAFNCKELTLLLLHPEAYFLYSRHFKCKELNIHAIGNRMFFEPLDHLVSCPVSWSCWQPHIWHSRSTSAFFNKIGVLWWAECVLWKGWPRFLFKRKKRFIVVLKINWQHIQYCLINTRIDVYCFAYTAAMRRHKFWLRWHSSLSLNTTRYTISMNVPTMKWLM